MCIYIDTQTCICVCNTVLKGEQGNDDTGFKIGAVI